MTGESRSGRGVTLCPGSHAVPGESRCARGVRFGLLGVLYSKLKLKSHKKIMVSMGPLEILSKSCRKGGAGSLRSLARDALARDFSGFLRSLGPFFQKSSSRVCNRCGYAGVRSKASHSRTPARFARAPSGRLRRASFELSHSQSGSRSPKIQKTKNPKNQALHARFARSVGRSLLYSTIYEVKLTLSKNKKKLKKNFLWVFGHQK